MTNLTLRSGIGAALPIVLAYLPVGFALGAASSKMGFSIFESAVCTSGIVNALDREFSPLPSISRAVEL